MALNVNIWAPERIQFPQVDFNDVAGNVTRVLVEAMFNSVQRLPALDANATGAQIFKAPYEKDNLPALDGIDAKCDSLKVTKAEFEEATSLANGAHASVATAVGQFVRGVNVVALNNEPVAKVLESFAGTFSRKATERIGWCLYYALPEPKAEVKGDLNSLDTSRGLGSVLKFGPQYLGAVDKEQRGISTPTSLRFNFSQ